MIPQTIPQDKFPLVLTRRIRVLGNYFFNLFLVTGQDKHLIFETGVSGMADAAISQLEALGVAPDYIVVSHPHADHLTGLPALAGRFPRARVVCGAGAPEFAAHPKAGAGLVREDRFISRALEQAGLDPGRPPLEAAPSLEDARVVESPVDLDLGGGVRVGLIPVRGHSPGNLIASVPRDRAVFCSDSMGFHYPGRRVWPLFFTGAGEYLRTIDRIEALAPAILAPAHQGPVVGEAVPGAIGQARNTALDIIRRIRTTRLADEDLVQVLFEESYRDEFTLYTRENIMTCTRLLLKRAREMP